jgi:hypothetical protein
MVCCDAKGFGGDEDEELLSELRMKGLLDRFEGLVLLGLGPPAMSSFVVTVLQCRVGNKERAAVEAGRGGAVRVDAAVVSEKMPDASGTRWMGCCGRRMAEAAQAGAGVSNSFETSLCPRQLLAGATGTS